MRAMILRKVAPVERSPLLLDSLPTPEPGPDEVRVQIRACGVCRTDLHVVEGDLPPRATAIVPGHEIVGRIDRVGDRVRSFAVGDAVGIPWLRHTCGACEYCLTGRENLCAEKQFTGYTANGGYADLAVADAAYVLPLPDGDPAHQAPLLCAGIIGYRALKLALPRPGGRIGFFGFGGSAHLALQLASRQGYETVAYSRSPSHRELATQLGAAATVDSSSERAAEVHPRLDSAVVFAPAGEVVLRALSEVKRGGCVSIAAILLTPIPTLDYDRLLFGERRLVSVEANTREDAREFLQLAARLMLESRITTRPLAEANEALADLKQGRVAGAVVLEMGRP